MKTTFHRLMWAAITGLACAPISDAQVLEIGDDPRPFVHQPGGAGLVVERKPERISQYAFMSLRFPSDMVPADLVNAEEVESPIEVWPELDVDFSWTTPTRGILRVRGAVLPEQQYRFRLRGGLTDEAGQPLKVAEWGVEVESEPLRLLPFYGTETMGLEDVGSRPEVRVRANYEVRLSDAARDVWFQDRLTRERFAAEILILPEYRSLAHVNMEEVETIEEAEEPEEVSGFLRFIPEEPLPVGASYDLVVDQVYDAYGGRGLSYPAVFPVGVTRPMELEFVAGRNPALEAPFIEARFRQALAPGELPPDALRITPEVPNLQLRKSGRSILAEGDFEVPGEYRVVVSEEVPGVRGYGLAEPESWTATFRPKFPQVMFPDEMLRMRSGLGLNFAFYQVNTPALTWRLAEVPMERLSEVQGRLLEFHDFLEDEDGNRLRNEAGRFMRVPTELLIDALELPEIASGMVPAAESAEAELRTLEWGGNEEGALSGPMLLEISGPDGRGGIVGNRAMIWFGNVAITRKVANEGWVIRVARMSDGLPVTGTEVELLDVKWNATARATTGDDGVVVFPDSQVSRDVVAFRTRVDGVETVQLFNYDNRFPGGSRWSRSAPAYRSFTLTERPLYRPGQTAYFKGWVRVVDGGEMTPVSRGEVDWKITRGWHRGEVIASGEAVLSEDGGWHGEWEIPEAGSLGVMRLHGEINGVSIGDSIDFQIQEFDPPPFSVECVDVEPSAPAESVVEVRSQYFHGAANAGAQVRWNAVWTVDGRELYSDDGFFWSDLFSEDSTTPSYSETVEGEALLDADGRVVLRSESPFSDHEKRARSVVRWTVDVIGPDGQTITAGSQHVVAMHPVLLGLTEEERGRTFRWKAEHPFAALPERVEARWFRVDAKTVRERLAPNVYRLRNFDVYHELGDPVIVEDEVFGFEADEPGRYVVRIAPVDGAPGIPVSLSTRVAGDGYSEVPVEAETAFRIEPARVDSNGSTPWVTGETATFEMITPATGEAWVTVETDEILESFHFPVTGNTVSLEIPVRSEYEPNAFLTAYLLRPGGDDQLAGERFGRVGFRAEAPDRHLDFEIGLDHDHVRPRESIAGTVRVTTAGQPVEGAGLVIYIVDDSILELGGWSEPDPHAPFFPRRQHQIATFSSLGHYVDGIESDWLTSKGFIIGDKGMPTAPGSVLATRENFLPLILWMPDARTDADGVVEFSCEAPDNLTRFRVIAVGQTVKNQFGMASETVDVRQPLQIEPALPRFLRQGDTVELRAVIRQTEVDSATVTVRCSTSGSLELTGDGEIEVEVPRDLPVVVRWQALAGDIGDGGVRFQADAADGLADDVRMKLDVEPAVITRVETVAGSWDQEVFEVGASLPDGWAEATGSAALTVSTREYLPKLMGIPYLLDFPHGCFEQQSSRLLAVTELGGLFDSLPDAGSRREVLEPWVNRMFEDFQRSLLPGGNLPYWPNGVTANTYVTVQTAWAVRAAERAGFAAPRHLSRMLPVALDQLLRGRTADQATLRAFALYIRALDDDADSDVLASVASDLYLHRDQMSGEGKAMLALALNHLGVEEERQRQLVGELPRDFERIGFNPATFSSAVRTEALVSWARLQIEPGNDAPELRQRMDRLMESSDSLSTQENLWLLIAFHALQRSVEAPAIGSLEPEPGLASPDGTAAVWEALAMDGLDQLSVRGLAGDADGSFVLRAVFTRADRETPLEDQGLRVERVVENLTERSRDGSAGSPFKLGDQIFISYRFHSPNLQSYVALEDLIPAGLEVVNPDLEAVGRYYSLPTDPVPRARLSHSELRDVRTLLYFDRLDSGDWSAAVLARATACGQFIWPATQMIPMYDSRFFGRSPSSEIHVVD